MGILLTPPRPTSRTRRVDTPARNVLRGAVRVLRGLRYAAARAPADGRHSPTPTEAHLVGWLRQGEQLTPGLLGFPEGGLVDQLEGHFWGAVRGLCLGPDCVYPTMWPSRLSVGTIIQAVHDPHCGGKKGLTHFSWAGGVIPNDLAAVLNLCVRPRLARTVVHAHRNSVPPAFEVVFTPQRWEGCTPRKSLCALSGPALTWQAVSSLPQRPECPSPHALAALAGPAGADEACALLELNRQLIVTHPAVLHLRATWIQLALASRSPGAAWQALLAALSTLSIARTSAAWARAAGCLLWALLARLPNRHSLARGMAPEWCDLLGQLGVAGAGHRVVYGGNMDKVFMGVAPAVEVDEEGRAGATQLLHLAVLQGHALPSPPAPSVSVPDPLLDSVWRSRVQASAFPAHTGAGSDMEE